MLIDLHTHSSRSDGTDTPAELVAKAAEQGLDVVALTDHDSTAGWAEAAAEAQKHPITLVHGLEISCRYAGTSVHLLAYEPDPADRALVDELERVLAGRSRRLPQTLERLAMLGVPVTLDEVHAVSGDAVAAGRPHVADAMIARGYIADREEGFERYLMPGRPAYVDRYAADLKEMIGLVAEAGGVTVVAHPWGRGSRHALDAGSFAELARAGLGGIEVDHLDHDETKRSRLRVIARDLDLVVTGSSDYHGAGKTGYDLACNTTAPREYDRLVERLGR